MPNTPNLGLPLLAAAQAQKHVTHNEALVALDTLVQLGVLDKDLTAPPASPAEGDRYLVAGAGPTGAWSGWSGRIARFQDGQWVSYVPKPGWFAFVADENDLYTYTGSAWTSFRAVVYALTTLQNLSLLGIGTTADATNPFSAKLNKALWTAKTVAEGGSGDLRYTLNKESSAKTLSLLLQSAFSGRAEIGLTGDDDLRLKVSADGAAWTEAVRIDRATGGIAILAAGTDLASAATTDLGSVPSLKVDITGTAAITSFGARPNVIKLVRFAGVVTLTHNATSLVLPGAANITTAAGDTAIVTSDGSGNFRVRHYQRADGRPVVATVTAADISDATATGRAVVKAADAATGATALGLGTGASPIFAGLSLTGALAISMAHPSLRFSKTAAAQDAILFGQTAGSNRWALNLANTAPESGGNAGSDFALYRYTDAGAYLDVPFAIARATADVTFGGILKPATDNARSLGTASARWAQLYAATTTINTSDAREKTEAQDPPPELLDAVLSVPIGGYQWLDSVARKGAAHARIHYGPTAQAVRDAIAAKGLDPGRYALFCEDPKIARVRKVRTVRRPLTETRTVEERVIAIADGKAVLRTVAREIAVERTARYPLVDGEGKPVMVPDPAFVPSEPGEAPPLVPAEHETVLTEEVEEAYFEDEAVPGETILGLRLDQFYALYTLAMRRRIAAHVAASGL